MGYILDRVFNLFHILLPYMALSMFKLHYDRLKRCMTGYDANLEDGLKPVPGRFNIHALN